MSQADVIYWKEKFCYFGRKGFIKIHVIINFQGMVIKTIHWYLKCFYFLPNSKAIQLLTTWPKMKMLSNNKTVLIFAVLHNGVYNRLIVSRRVNTGNTIWASCLLANRSLDQILLRIKYSFISLSTSPIKKDTRKWEV